MICGANFFDVRPCLVRLQVQAAPCTPLHLSMDRATAFGTIAADYDRYRPPPPPAVADWLLPEGAHRVADVCAGTGGFSRVLAGRVRDVIAVDLDTRMLALARPRVLPLCGRGEALPIRPSSVDALLVSSGWHWLDEEAAVAEAARVLRPGGVLGVVWNGPARDIEWVADILGRGNAPRRRVHQLRIPADAPFAPTETRVVEWSLTRTVPQLAGLAGTYSRFITRPGFEPADLRQMLASHPRLQDRDRIELPMTARCWRTARI
jgi:SAM-dependent methyltransferase